jgi:twitching motility protein PilU
MDISPLFKLMAEKQGSDLYITAGAPIQVCIDGVTQPVNAQMLTPDVVKK